MTRLLLSGNFEWSPNPKGEGANRLQFRIIPVLADGKGNQSSGKGAISVGLGSCKGFLKGVEK